MYDAWGAECTSCIWGLKFEPSIAALHLYSYHKIAFSSKFIKIINFYNKI